MSRVYTVEESRNQVLTQIRDLSLYWSSLPDKTPAERCDGVAFSLLNLFDGGSMNLPAMDIVLRPNMVDKAFCINNGENWYEDGIVINEDCALHELYCKGGL